MSSLVQSHCHEGRAMSEEVTLRWVGLVEEVGLSLE